MEFVSYEPLIEHVIHAFAKLQLFKRSTLVITLAVIGNAAYSEV